MISRRFIPLRPHPQSRRASGHRPRRPRLWSVPALGLALALLLAAASRPAPEAPAGPRLFIIDDDVGMLKQAVRGHGPYPAPWIPITDPDGGLEVIYVLGDPSARVLGITCAMGCSTTDVCMESVKKILELTGRTDVPVLRGASSPHDLGRPTDAARFIVDTVMAHPHEVEIIATAPLTNIATAVMIEPRLPQNWKALHLATGEFMGELGVRSDAYPFRYLGYQDLNINVDPEAARFLLEHGGDFIIYPNEIMDDASLTMSDRRGLERAATPLSTWVASQTAPFTILGSTIARLAGWHGMYLHGVIPAAIALDPSLAAPPVMRRVTMVHRRAGGYTFALTDDPQVPERPVYLKLNDPERVKQRLLEKCK